MSEVKYRHYNQLNSQLLKLSDNLNITRTQLKTSSDQLNSMQKLANNHASQLVLFNLIHFLFISNVTRFMAVSKILDQIDEQSS